MKNISKSYKRDISLVVLGFFLSMLTMQITWHLERLKDKREKEQNYSYLLKSTKQEILFYVEMYTTIIDELGNIKLNYNKSSQNYTIVSGMSNYLISTKTFETFKSELIKYNISSELFKDIIGANLLLETFFINTNLRLGFNYQTFEELSIVVAKKKTSLINEIKMFQELIRKIDVEIDECDI